MTATAWKRGWEKLARRRRAQRLGSRRMMGRCWGPKKRRASARMPYLSSVQWVCNSHCLFCSHQMAWSDQSCLRSAGPREGGGTHQPQRALPPTLSTSLGFRGLWWLLLPCPSHGQDQAVLAWGLGPRSRQNGSLLANPDCPSGPSRYITSWGVLNSESGRPNLKCPHLMDSSPPVSSHNSWLTGLSSAFLGAQDRAHSRASGCAWYAAAGTREMSSGS